MTLMIPTGVTCFTILLAASVVAESADVDWPYHGRDAASTKFSPLSEIDRHNLADLRVVWRWKAPDAEVLAEALSFAAFSGRIEAATSFTS